MNETFSVEKRFTFETLDINKFISLIKDFINQELDTKEKFELQELIIVWFEDKKRDVSLTEVKKVFQSKKFDQIALTIKERLNYETTLTIVIERQPNSFTIAHDNVNYLSGKNLYNGFVKKLKLIDVYDFRLIQIKSRAERSYMEEALICKNSGALRAAIIIGWTGVMNRIYSEIDKKHKDNFILKIKLKHKENKKFKLKTINKLEDYQQFKDRDVLEICKTLYLDKGLSNQLFHYLDMRNDCGHVRLWKPSKSTVEAFFDEIFKNMF